MSESVAEPTPEQIKTQRSALIIKFSTQIWDFILSDARNTYFLHEDELIADASESTRKLIKDREITLDQDEAAVIDYYLFEAKSKISELFMASDQLHKLIDLEGIYAKNTLTLTSSESTLRLGAISMGGATQQEATILIPKEFERFLNLRNAAATLERAVGDTTDEPYGRILKVPGLLAVSAIAELLEDPQPAAEQTGHYL